MGPAPRVVWTVGHSTRPIESFVRLLRDQRVALLMDVRTVPRSRRNPQFDRETLPGELARQRISYRHEPGLGGLRKPREDSCNAAWRNPGFRGYADYMQSADFSGRIEELVAVAGSGNVALMCAEVVPWRCHRSLIADALVVRGIEVRHIIGPEQVERHRLTPFARVDGDRITYPGLAT